MLSLHMVTGLAKESTPTRLNGDTERQSGKVVPEKKEQPESCGGRKRRKPKILSLEKEMTTTLVFLSGKSDGQRSLVGYSPSTGLQRVGHDLAHTAHRHHAAGEGEKAGKAG